MSTRATAILVLVLMSCQLCRADGMFVSRSYVEQKPNIPFQKALIVFDGFSETLIIDTALDGAPGSYSWIIPIPAPPTKVSKVHPATVDSAILQLPLYDAGTKNFLFPILIPFAALIAILAFAAPYRYKKSRGENLKLFLVECAFVGITTIIVGAVVFPVFASADHKGFRSGPEHGFDVDILGSGTAGNYDFSIVQGDKSDDLISWLNANGTPLPMATKNSVESYVRDHWCFFAAKIRKDSKQPLSPHPIKLTFPTDKAIYPMRLTAFGSRSLGLELVVIGPRQAYCTGMELRQVKQCKRPYGNPEAREFSQFERRSAAWFFHPDIAPHVKESMAATRLVGTFLPSEMSHDLEIGWRDYSGIVRVPTTKQAAENATLIGLAATTIVLIFFTCVSIVLGFTPTLSFFGLIGSAALVFLAVRFTTLAVNPGMVATSVNSRQSPVHPVIAISSISKTLSDGIQGPLSLARIRAKIQQLMEEFKERGVPLENSRTQGGYTIDNRGKEWHIVYLDSNLIPHDTIVKEMAN